MIESKRLTAVLWSLVLISAFAVVDSTYDARQAFFEWQALQKSAHAMDVEWGQLLIEKSTLSSYARLENLATDKLQMSMPATDQIIVVDAKGIK